MSKVIRISDEIFSRLQGHSVPLVDTPASVIEKVLDFYEQFHQSEIQMPKTKKSRGNESFIQGEQKMELESNGLYLAPASKENLQKSIICSIPLDFARSHLFQEKFNKLENALEGKDKFHCWAMTRNSRSKFNSMEKNDLVLFTTKGTGYFSIKARVLFKLESEPLGNAIWSVVPGSPWELIYFLEDVTSINVPKDKFVRALGYDSGYVVPGIIRVATERVDNAVRHHGSIQNLIESLAE